MKETNFVQPSTAVLPRVLHSVLCSQACHGRNPGVTPTNPSGVGGYFVQKFRPNRISRLKKIKKLRAVRATIRARCRRNFEKEFN